MFVFVPPKPANPLRVEPEYKKCRRCKAVTRLDSWHEEPYSDTHDTIVCPQCQSPEPYSYLNYRHFRGWKR